jgi:hypothetical protein
MPRIFVLVYRWDNDGRTGSHPSTRRRLVVNPALLQGGSESHRGWKNFHFPLILTTLNLIIVSLLPYPLNTVRDTVATMCLHPCLRQGPTVRVFTVLPRWNKVTVHERSCRVTLPRLGRVSPSLRSTARAFVSFGSQDHVISY